jgi:hypothetical protein
MPLVIACPSVELLRGKPKRAALSHQQDACQHSEARKTTLWKIRIAAKLLHGQQLGNRRCCLARNDDEVMTVA